MEAIDISKYKLPKSNFHVKVHKKSQIVIGHSFSKDMNHYKGWLKRYNGIYKNTSTFTIDINGNIYQHFDPKYYSDFLKKDKHNENIISILLENEGWLSKNEFDGNYYTHTNDKYEGRVFVKNWRNENFWCSYTDKQMSSLIELSRYLSDKFNIPFKSIGHNTKVDGIYDYNGIVFRSNFSKQYSDLSPAFNYELYNNEIHNYETLNNTI